MQRLLRLVVTTLCLALMLTLSLSACSHGGERLADQIHYPDDSVAMPMGERVVYLLQPSSLRLIRHDVGVGPISVEQLLKLLINAAVNDDLISPVPEGVALKLVGVEDKIVTIEIDAQDTLHWGTRREAVLFDAVVLTLSELPKVDAIRFVVKDGRYRGRIDLGEPFDRSRLLAPQESYELR